jgi:hypothetical protein
VVLLVATLLLLTFLDRFVLVELLLRRIGLPLLVAALEALAILGAGFVARRRRGDPIVQFLIGYPLFGAVCFLVALARVDTATMAVTLLAFGALGLWSLRGMPVRATPDSESSARSSPAALFAIALVFVCAAVAAQGPPVSLDELAYHLAIPHAWVIEGRAIDLPLISHSYFPLGIESADLPPLAILGALLGGIASHLVHLLAAVATTLLIQRRTRDALVTAAIVATPALALTAGWSLVDWPLLGICLVFLDDDERPGALAAGLLAKYTFLPFAIVVLAIRRRFDRRRLVFGAIAGSLFFVRNLVLTGNPLAPFLSHDAPHVTGYRTLTLGSYVFDGRFLDEALGAALLPVLVSLSAAVPIALAVGGVLLLLLAPSARILLPFFGAAASEARLAWRPARTVIAAAIACQLFLIGYFTVRSDAFSLLAATASDGEYLAHVRPSFTTVEWLNASLPPASKTLVVGLNETYWFARRVRGGGNFDGPRVSRYLESATPEALRERLAREHFTHVAVIEAGIPTLVAQKQEERQTRLTPAAQRSLSQMLDKYASGVATRGNTALFTLR